VTQFAGQVDLTEGGPVQAFFGKTMLLYLPLLFTCPLLTMRLFAEERRSGTIEALLTAPVSSTGRGARQIRGGALDLRADVGADAALRPADREDRGRGLARRRGELPRACSGSGRAIWRSGS
jgi:hypothetical protein